MLRKIIAPLRECVGGAVPAVSVTVTGKSWTDGEMLVDDVRRRASTSEILNNSLYSQFFPSLVAGPQNAPAGYVPMAGMTAFPLPADDLAPLGSLSGFASLAVLTRNNVAAELDSRRFWIELTFEFDKEILVGGIVLAGMPSLPYTIDRAGRTTSNFGLPREIRVTWTAPTDSKTPSYIDDEEMVTRQEMLSHGGVHVVRIPPAQTKRLKVRLADFPRIMKSVESRTSATGPTATNVVERWGALVPMIAVFAHTERTRFRPRVSGGVLESAVLQAGVGTWTPGDVQALERLGEWGASADSLMTIGNEYFSMSASSIFGPRRTFAPAGAVSPPFDEFFRSLPLKPNEQIRLWLQQSESHERCIGGVSVDLVNAWSYVRTGTGPRGFETVTERAPDTLRVQIYEVEAPESLAVPRIDLASRYGNCLADVIVARGTLDKQTVKCRFVRPSLCRHFAVVLTAVAGNGPVMIGSLTFVQSTTITLTPRPAVSQLLRNVHFRFIGTDLAGDYSTFGSRGAALVVERVTAGERRDVMFQADHLLDLLHGGVARLFSNHRYEETVMERSKADGTSVGWRRAETGAGVSWGNTHPNGPSAQSTFAQYGNQKVRTHTRHLSAFPNSSRSAVNELVDEVTVPDESTELAKLDGALWKGWQKLSGTDTASTAAVENALRVDGVVNVNLPPGYSTIKGALDSLQSAFAAGDAVALAAAFRDLLSAEGRDTFLANGVTAGVSVGASFIAGANGSVSMAWPVPVVSRTGLFGSSGTITQQGSETPYSYAQHLNTGAEHQESTRHVIETTKARRTGYEVQWLGQRVDIVSGVVPVRAELPALAGRIYHTSDDAVRVRVCGGVPDPAVSVDVWFELDEEPVRDDR